MQGLMRPFGAGLPRADMTIDPDLCDIGTVFEVEGRGIAYVIHMRALAAQRHHQPAFLGMAADHGAFRRTAYGEELTGIGQFHELRHDPPRHGKSTVNVPYRTGTALLGQREGRGVEPLSDIARLVDPQKEERNALRPIALQCRKSLARLLE